MTLSLNKSVDGLRTQETHRTANLWKIVTADGLLTLRFADFDRPLEFDDGSGAQTYSPFGGWDSSARQLQAGLRDTNVDTRGIIDSDTVTHEDLRAGRFNQASVTEYLVDWKYPHAGPFRTRIYTIGSLKFTGEVWTAELNSLTSKLQGKTGRFYNRVCDADLFDNRCKVVASSFSTSSISVSSGTQDVTYPRRIFDASGLSSQVDGYYNYGEIAWITGDNADRGIISEIKVFTDAASTIELYVDTPFDIGNTDTFTIRAGCDKLVATCHNKFNNLVHFRAFPHIPSSDKVLRTPRNG